jgi:hypothetical protein
VRDRVTHLRTDFRRAPRCASFCEVADSVNTGVYGRVVLLPFRLAPVSPRCRSIFCSRSHLMSRAHRRMRGSEGAAALTSGRLSAAAIACIALTVPHWVTLVEFVRT